MFFWLVILFLTVCYGNALTCLQCDGVSQPRHCRYVAECFDDEVCGVERVTNAFGQSTYNVGCIHTSRCANSNSGSSTGSCHQCCSSNLCNAEGCGEIGYPDNRGPVCYYCPVQVDIKSCGTIEFCEQGEVCSYSVREEFGDMVYSSGCLNRHSCSSTGVSSAVIVGRDLRSDITESRDNSESRDVIESRDSAYREDQTILDIRSVKDVVCSGCCKEDLCNRDCNGTGSSQTQNFCLSNPCQRGTCLNGEKSFMCLCPGGVVGSLCETVLPTDCYDILEMGIGNTTDVYGIYLWRSHKLIDVLCDIETDGGGWTVFQHRFNGSENFNRSFSEYTSGFGDPRGEYWLGLENIYELANITSDMRIELTTTDGNGTYQLFNNFSLAPFPEYSIMFSSSNGTAGNGFIGVHPPFSTYDNEQDLHKHINCGQFYGAGWWYEDCRGVDLNAPICDDDNSCWRYHAYLGMMFSPLKTSMMMLRRI